MLLKGKVAWVTGASRGIGKATALSLAAQGAVVILSASNMEHLKDTGQQIKKITGREPFLIGYDVADYTKIKEAFATVFKKFKRVDIMVNNAGILIDSLLGMVTPEMLQRTFAVNTYAVIYHMQYASRLMARYKSGTIINVSSIIGRVGNEGQVVYAASKAAVIGATMSAAKELAPLNIRVNAVAPGFIDTDMVKQLSPEKYTERVAGIKMKRAGQPEEVAKTILFLASDESAYVTGQVLGVDGGMLV